MSALGRRPGQFPEHLESLHRLLDLEAAIIDQAYYAESTRRDQQTQRLAMLGQVSGGIAHELRNPLNVVKTSVYYLQNVRAASSEKVTEHLQRIERQVNLASDAISAISEFAKIGTPDWITLKLSDHLTDWVDNHCFNPDVRVELDLQAAGPFTAMHATCRSLSGTWSATLVKQWPAAVS